MTESDYLTVIFVEGQSRSSKNIYRPLGNSLIELSRMKNGSNRNRPQAIRSIEYLGEANHQPGLFGEAWKNDRFDWLQLSDPERAERL